MVSEVAARTQGSNAWSSLCGFCVFGNSQTAILDWTLKTICASMMVSDVRAELIACGSSEDIWPASTE
jgi:hypothetical protein